MAPSANKNAEIVPMMRPTKFGPLSYGGLVARMATIPSSLM